MKKLSDLTINALEEGLLWQALPKNSILFPYYFKEMATTETIIRTQIQRNRTQPSFDMAGDYRYIKVDLHMVMYDCLLASETNGFFDNDDLPPPELWIDYHDGELVAIVPPALEACVQDMLGDTGFNAVEWCEKPNFINQIFNNNQENKIGKLTKLLRKFF